MVKLRGALVDWAVEGGVLFFREIFLAVVHLLPRVKNKHYHLSPRLRLGGGDIYWSRFWWEVLSLCWWLFLNFMTQPLDSILSSFTWEATHWYVLRWKTFWSASPLAALHLPDRADHCGICFLCNIPCRYPCVAEVFLATLNKIAALPLLTLPLLCVMTFTSLCCLPASPRVRTWTLLFPAVSLTLRTLSGTL